MLWRSRRLPALLMLLTLAFASVTWLRGRADRWTLILLVVGLGSGCISLIAHDRSGGQR